MVGFQSILVLLSVKTSVAITPVANPVFFNTIKRQTFRVQFYTQDSRRYSSIESLHFPTCYFLLSRQKLYTGFLLNILLSKLDYASTKQELGYIYTS